MMAHAMNVLLAALAFSALRVLVLAGIAGLGIVAYRSASTAVRFFVWRTVLVAALVMPLLGPALPKLAIPLPQIARLSSNRPKILTQVASEPIPVRTTVRFDSQRTNSPEAAPTSSTTLVFQPRKSPFRIAVGWSIVLPAIYLLMAGILLFRLVLGLLLSRRLVRSARDIDERRFPLVLGWRSVDTRLPRVSESELISVPVTIGVIRPSILLPMDWREWDEATLDAVIAHEASHVVRHDALTQSLSLLHRAIFWFSPLAWWLDRHLSALAEQASDEAALAQGADRKHYAKALLDFFQAVQARPGRIWWQGVSIANGGANAGNAERRMEQILAWKGSIMNMKKSLAIAIIVFAIPVVYLVASAHPAVQSEKAPTVQEAPSAAPTTAPADVAPMPAAPIGGVAGSGPATAPVDPDMATAPAAPDSPPSDDFSRSSHHGYSFSDGDDDEDRFVIVSGKSDSYTMSGSSQDVRHAERLKKQISGPFIWFQRDEKSYIIRDQATVTRAISFWAPQQELGKKQEALGKQQEALGKQQEALGKKMEAVRVNIPDMTAELDALKAKLQKLGPTATMDQVGELQSEIGELQSKMGELQSRAGEQQGKLGEEQGKLGEQQGKLGEEQGKLGEQQAELAEKASKQMKELLDEAIKNGKAQPEADSSQGASL
ncbi:MAG TPA: M56 family metallopeptidase [Candidatus Sulfotelmatobacter sp.]|nr:M56 family metallopeptidase [Candidatus Sulfotelmatobacter sp.]